MIFRKVPALAACSVLLAVVGVYLRLRHWRLSKLAVASSRRSVHNNGLHARVVVQTANREAFLRQGVKLREALAKTSPWEEPRGEFAVDDAFRQWIFLTTEGLQSPRYWTAEVLNVPPGSLIRQNGDVTEEEDKDASDAAAAVARVTRAAGSRPSSEEMLRRGYMLRKGDTLSCKMLMLTDGEMRNRGDKEHIVDMLSEWSRQNHMAYAAERGYCLLHARCVVRARAGEEKSFKGVTNVSCDDEGKFMGYAVLMHLIRHVLVNPTESYVVKMDVDAFLMDFDPRFEDFVTTAEQQMTEPGYGASRESEGGFIQRMFTSVMPQPLKTPPRVSLLMAMDEVCSVRTPHNSGVVVWRGCASVLDVLDGLLRRHTRTMVASGDQILLSAELNELHGLDSFASSVLCSQVKFQSKFGAPGILLNWSRDSFAAIYTARTFNVGPWGWQPTDFVLHFMGFSGANRMARISRLCEEAVNERVCPWLELEERADDHDD